MSQWIPKIGEQVLVRKGAPIRKAVWKDPTQQWYWTGYKWWTALRSYVVTVTDFEPDLYDYDASLVYWTAATTGETNIASLEDIEPISHLELLARAGRRRR